MDTVKKYFNEKTLLIITSLLVVLHPVIELDYLASEFLSPRFTTILDFIVLPLLVLLTFVLNDNDKKKTFTVAGIWGILLGVFFILHVKNANGVYDSLHLPDNFYFTVKEELFYLLTLLLPLAYVYVYKLNDIKEEIFKWICIGSSLCTAFPIVVSDLLVFGMSTYSGTTVKDSIFAWFALPFEAKGEFSPRNYACKFFFEEGNTTGILMLLVLPFLYYFLYREKDNIKKALMSVLIFVHSLAMIMISTRVATYGTALVPIVILAVYIVLLALKEEKLDKVFIILLVLFTAVNSMIIPYSPGYQNQQFDAQSDLDLGNADSEFGERKKQIKDEINNTQLMPYSEEWYNFYIHIFEDNVWLINATPKNYFLSYYHYTYDPKFWVDVIFDIDLEDRISGRQIENIFQHYKWDPLSFKEKSLGMGYSTFMWGSILLEQDFTQQIFSYGYIGFILIMFPWIMLLIYAVIKILTGYKKGYWTFFNVLLMMSICMSFGCGYLSGHTFDELSTSLFLALCFGTLFKNMNKRVKE